MTLIPRGLVHSVPLLPITASLVLPLSPRVARTAKSH